MNSREQRTARAMTYLLTQVEACREKGVVRLPTVVELAKEAGVSPVTMRKAVSRLAVRGVLSSRPSSGIRLIEGASVPEVSETVTESKEPAAFVPQWERIVAAIAGDIRSGRYAPGALLPSHQELGEHYGCCYRTLRKSLLTLADSGQLERHKKRFRVPVLAAEQSNARLLVVAVGGASERSTDQHALGPGFVGALELEAAVADVPLRVVWVDSEDPGAAAKKAAQEKRTSGLVMVYCDADSRVGAQDLQALRRLKLPTAVVDASGAGDTPTLRPEEPSVRVFGLSVSPLCGKLMGAYLASRGYRRPAFVSTSHALPWSEQRLDGLRRAYHDAGMGHVVVSCTARGGSDGTRHDGISPLVNKALSAGADVVVGVDDQTALAARSRLGKTKQGIAIAGFGDTPGASRAGLTSYSHNLAGVAREALRHVLASDRAAPHDRPLEVAGVVVERSSTRPEA